MTHPDVRKYRKQCLQRYGLKARRKRSDIIVIQEHIFSAWVNYQRLRSIQEAP
jgi:hypothetical protein